MMSRRGPTPQRTSVLDMSLFFASLITGLSSGLGVMASLFPPSAIYHCAVITTRGCFVPELVSAAATLIMVCGSRGGEGASNKTAHSISLVVQNLSSTGGRGGVGPREGEIAGPQRGGIGPHLFFPHFCPPCSPSIPFLEQHA